MVISLTERRDSFALGPLAVDLSAGLIRSASGAVKVSPRGMDVLRHLAENHTRVVTSDELLNRFWSPLA